MKDKFADRYILGEGYPMMYYDFAIALKEKPGLHYLQKDIKPIWPKELWDNNVCKYRLVLERIEKEKVDDKLPQTLYEKIAEDTFGKGNRSIYCKICGQGKAVDPVYCLAHSWQTCCGYTMSLDKPKEKG